MGEPEKVAIIDTVVKAHRGRRFTIAGIDNLSSTEAIRECRQQPLRASHIAAGMVWRTS